MEKDFYKILGVKKNAPLEEVVNAFREAAKKHHPDKGGDPKIFKLLSRAYAVIKDPVKRNNYDRTGNDDPREVLVRNKVISAIHEMLGAILNDKHVDKVADGEVDIIKHLIKNCQAARDSFQNEINKRERRLKRANRIRKRFYRKKKDGPDFVGEYYKITIDAIKQEIESIKIELEVSLQAEKLLSTYGFEFEEQVSYNIIYGGASTSY